MEKKRILFVSQEIHPYLPESELSKLSLALPKAMNEDGYEVRVFMPRFGVINERRHQLHEVIRLSGMNLIINDMDQPLIIKVASVPSARLQVYFIDNDEYFKRKSVHFDEKKNFHADNGERALFFCRGVIETVKKLGWAPDLIHCHGWMTALLPLYLKQFHADDPLFQDSKVVFSAYPFSYDGRMGESLEHCLSYDGVSQEVIDQMKDANVEKLNRIGAKYCDAVVWNSEKINQDTASLIREGGVPALDVSGEEEPASAIKKFYESTVMEQSMV